jgi:hypothetical protein
MGFPDSAGLNVFAGRHRGRCAQQCDELVVPFNFDSQDAKAAIRIVKGNALNQTRQWLPLARVIRPAVLTMHRVTILRLR